VPTDLGFLKERKDVKRGICSHYHQDAKLAYFRNSPAAFVFDQK